MPTATRPDTVTVNLTRCKEVACIPAPGRITSIDLVFKDTVAQYPLPAMHLVVVVRANDTDVIYQQALGTQYPWEGNHESEHTHNQITSLMRLSHVSSWNSIVGQTVLVLHDQDDPAVIYGLCDVERKRFCQQKEGGLILFWDE